MRVICWGRGGSLVKAREAGYEAAASREEFFETSDIISLHLPLRPDSRGIVTPADLARMKPTALLVNISRGALIGDQPIRRIVTSCLTVSEAAEARTSR